jgi:Ala-tRNA(Pro) deacylase
MPVQRLKDYLDENDVRYLSIRHPLTYSGQQTAEAAHVPGKLMAKTVMVKLDGRMVMAVVPATSSVDLRELARATGSAHAALADEAEFYRLFPDCEPGAMPPFGNLYGIPVYVSHEFAVNRWIAFNAGTHEEVIEMNYGEFARLARPTALYLSTHETHVDTEVTPISVFLVSGL